MFIYIWEYEVREQQRRVFEQVYGPEGDWVQLFRQGEGYLHTRLYRDAKQPGRYLTIDAWESRTARDRFRAQFAGPFAALDAACEALAARETFVGDFETVAG